MWTILGSHIYPLGFNWMVYYYPSSDALGAKTKDDFKIPRNLSNLSSKQSIVTISENLIFVKRQDDKSFKIVNNLCKLPSRQSVPKYPTFRNSPGISHFRNREIPGDFIEINTLIRPKNCPRICLPYQRSLSWQNPDNSYKFPGNLIDVKKNEKHAQKPETQSIPKRNKIPISRPSWRHRFIE